MDQAKTLEIYEKYIALLEEKVRFLENRQVADSKLARAESVEKNVRPQPFEETDLARRFQSEKLQELRIKAGLSQTKLAEMLGCSGSAVSGWEQNKWLPTPDLLEKLPAALNCELKDLLENSK